MLKTLQGFKDFIMRGNVIDLAVGIVIGAAFTGLVASFTGSFIDPLIKVFGSGGSGVAGATPDPPHCTGSAQVLNPAGLRTKSGRSGKRRRRMLPGHFVVGRDLDGVDECPLVIG